MKTSPLLLFFAIFLAAGAASFFAWTLFGPAVHAPSAHVKVAQPPPQTILPAIGDEKSEPEAVGEGEPMLVAIPPPPPDNAPPVAAPPAEASQQVATIAPPPAPEKALPHNGPPKIAVVIDDLGLDIPGTRRATALPAFVTLSFMPYAAHLKEQTEAGKARGHELLLHMPMEPMGHDDPGPGALFVALPPEEIKRRFDAALESFSGFDGVNNHMGSKFTADAPGMEIVIDELQERHLFFLDSRTSSKTVGESIARQHGLPTIARDIFLDDDMAIAAVRTQMQDAERVARRKGEAVVIGHPHPATLEALEVWLPDAQSRGFVFVPLHDLVDSR